MKFPVTPEGPSSSGESGLRTLQRTDPGGFTTRNGTDFVAHTKGGRPVVRPVGGDITLTFVGEGDVNEVQNFERSSPRTAMAKGQDPVEIFRMPSSESVNGKTPVLYEGPGTLRILTLHVVPETGELGFLTMRWKVGVYRSVFAKGISEKKDLNTEFMADHLLLVHLAYPTFGAYSTEKVWVQLLFGVERINRGPDPSGGSDYEEVRPFCVKYGVKDGKDFEKKTVIPYHTELEARVAIPIATQLRPNTVLALIAYNGSYSYEENAEVIRILPFDERYAYYGLHGYLTYDSGDTWEHMEDLGDFEEDIKSQPEPHIYTSTPAYTRIAEITLVRALASGDVAFMTRNALQDWFEQPPTLYVGPVGGRLERVGTFGTVHTRVVRFLTTPSKSIICFIQRNEPDAPMWIAYAGLEMNDWKVVHLPWPSYLTGYLRTRNPNQHNTVLEVLVYYKEAYRVAESFDLGETWVYGPPIFKNVPQASLEIPTYHRFSGQLYLMQNGRPAISAPEWLYNPDVTPPWEG